MEVRANEPEKTGFFIVGAAKAGTSALHYLLSMHPEVTMSSVKEPNYFSWDLIEQQQLYYGAPQVRLDEAYEALFQGKEGGLRGEASVSYLFYPEVASRLYDYNPKAKIIIILREPIARAQSHYGMDRALGLIDTSLAEVWNNGAEHPKTGLHFQQYFALGRYSDQIERYLNVFPKKQVMVLLHKDLREDRKQTIDRLLEFLNLGPYPELPAEEEVNTGMTARNVLVAKLYTSKPFRILLKRILGNRLGRAVKKVFFTREQVNSTPYALMNLWSQYYLQDIKRLEQIIGRKLDAWKR